MDPNKMFERILQQTEEIERLNSFIAWVLEDEDISEYWEEYFRIFGGGEEEEE